mmetsp:Transcript_1832/g.3806  ORF Transcript_1832/g.3806 Transcript_1832/m.3806 type:complete len:82 (-) Transcript_1832:13-258(-)
MRWRVGLPQPQQHLSQCFLHSSKPCALSEILVYYYIPKSSGPAKWRSSGDVSVSFIFAKTMYLLSFAMTNEVLNKSVSSSW